MTSKMAKELLAERRTSLGPAGGGGGGGVSSSVIDGTPLPRRYAAATAAKDVVGAASTTATRPAGVPVQTPKRPAAAPADQSGGGAGGGGPGGGGLQLLKKKLDDQRTELEARTDAINSVQRNFESLSELYAKDRDRHGAAEAQVQTLTGQLDALRTHVAERTVPRVDLERAQTELTAARRAAAAEKEEGARHTAALAEAQRRAERACEAAKLDHTELRGRLRAAEAASAEVVALVYGCEGALKELLAEMQACVEAARVRADAAAARGGPAGERARALRARLGEQLVPAFRRDTNDPAELAAALPATARLQAAEACLRRLAGPCVKGVAAAWHDEATLAAEAAARSGAAADEKRRRSDADAAEARRASQAAADELLARASEVGDLTRAKQRLAAELEAAREEAAALWTRHKEEREVAARRAAEAEAAAAARDAAAQAATGAAEAEAAQLRARAEAAEAALREADASHGEEERARAAEAEAAEAAAAAAAAAAQAGAEAALRGRLEKAAAAAAAAEAAGRARERELRRGVEVGLQKVRECEEERERLQRQQAEQSVEQARSHEEMGATVLSLTQLLKETRAEAEVERVAMARMQGRAEEAEAARAAAAERVVGLEEEVRAAATRGAEQAATAVTLREGVQLQLEEAETRLRQLQERCDAEAARAARLAGHKEDEVRELQKRLAEVAGEVRALAASEQALAAHKKQAAQAAEELRAARGEVAAAREKEKEVQTMLGALEGVQTETALALKKLLASEESCESAYACLSCFGTLKEPMLCNPCGHTFCKGCLADKARRNSHGDSFCPECNDFSVTSAIPLKTLDLLIGRYQYRTQVLTDLQSALGTASGRRRSLISLSDG